MGIGLAISSRAKLETLYKAIPIICTWQILTNIVLLMQHGGNRWYDFDDSHVYPIGLEKIKTSAAYVLFYRRVIEVWNPSRVSEILDRLKADHICKAFTIFDHWVCIHRPKQVSFFCCIQLTVSPLSMTTKGDYKLGGV